MKDSPPAYSSTFLLFSGTSCGRACRRVMFANPSMGTSTRPHFVKCGRRSALIHLYDVCRIQGGAFKCSRAVTIRRSCRNFLNTHSPSWIALELHMNGIGC